MANQCCECGKELAKNAAFCVECGAIQKQDGTISAHIELDNDTKAEHLRNVTRAIPHANTPICPKCGNRLAIGALFCTDCGTAQTQNSAQPDTNTEQLGDPPAMSKEQDIDEDLADKLPIHEPKAAITPASFALTKDSLIPETDNYDSPVPVHPVQNSPEKLTPSDSGPSSSSIGDPTNEQHDKSPAPTFSGSPIINSPASQSGQAQVISSVAGNQSTNSMSFSDASPTRSKTPLIVGLSVIAVIIIAIAAGAFTLSPKPAATGHAQDGSQTDSAIRSQGSLPNIPAVMASLSDWTEDDYAKAMSIDGPNADTLSQPVAGLPLVTFERNSPESDYQRFTCTFYNDPAQNSDGVTDDSLILLIAPQYTLMSHDATELIAAPTRGTGFELAQAINDNIFQNLDLFNFGEDDAEKLLAEMGVEDYQVLGEWYWERAVTSAVDHSVGDIGATGKPSPQKFGRIYSIEIRTKDLSQQDIYISILATNTPVVSATTVTDSALSIVPSEAIVVTASKDKAMIDPVSSYTDFGFQRVTTPGTLVSTSTQSGQSAEQQSEHPSSGAAATSSATSGNDYILPESATRVYTMKELQSLSTYELFLARNEIYARHGRKFQSENLQKHFNSTSWYEGTIEPSDFSESMLNSNEKTNAYAIREIEEKRNSPYL